MDMVRHLLTLLIVLAAFVITSCMSVERHSSDRLTPETKSRNGATLEVKSRKGTTPEAKSHKQTTKPTVLARLTHSDIAELWLAIIRRRYSNNESFRCPFQRKNDRGEDWLKSWTGPRLELSEEDRLAGEALLSEFGTKYMPNAYANFEKARDTALELQQIFNEEFAEPRSISSSSPKWNAFNKLLEKFVQARTDYILCHDELCHYWLANRLGVLEASDLAKADSKELTVQLLPENFSRASHMSLRVKPMESTCSEFVSKYAPESYAIYQKLEREFKETDALLMEVRKQRIQMDDVRHSRVWTAVVDKKNELARELKPLLKTLEAWQCEHRTTVKSAEDVAACDQEMAHQLKPFLDALPNFVKIRALGPIIPDADMIAIPGKNYRMQRTEVTQIQWMAVMGHNPSTFEGPNHPVENVSWEDCKEFIRRLNILSDGNYRLPTEQEWEYACLAGSKDRWGKRRNGTKKIHMMWCEENSQRHTWAVALREPNAWGLFDMHGNVAEWCEASNLPHVNRGGSFLQFGRNCSVYARDTEKDENDGIGFRLVISQN